MMEKLSCNCRWWRPSTVATSTNLVVLVHWLMGVLLVGWTIFFSFTLWRFRASQQPKASYTGVQGHASTRLELEHRQFRAVLLIGFAIPLWAKVADDFPSDKDDGDPSNT